MRTAAAARASEAGAVAAQRMRHRVGGVAGRLRECQRAERRLAVARWRSPRPSVSSVVAPPTPTVRSARSVLPRRAAPPRTPARPRRRPTALGRHMAAPACRESPRACAAWRAGERPTESTGARARGQGDDGVARPRARRLDRATRRGGPRCPCGRQRGVTLARASCGVDLHGEQERGVAADVDDGSDERRRDARRGHHATEAVPAPPRPASSRQRDNAASARSASARRFSRPRSGRPSGGNRP